MKLLKKISVGSINGVRGGFSDIVKRERLCTVGGITGSYKEKTSETLGTSYGFQGEFRAINRHGEECSAAVCYLPEPAQSLLKQQIDNLATAGALNVEFGFHINAVPDATAIKGYVFEVESVIESRPSLALAELSQRIGMNLPSAALPVEEVQAAIGHDSARHEAVKASEAMTKGAAKRGK